VLRALENLFLYRPVRYADGWEDPPPGLPVEDVELTGAGGTRLHAWWAAPQGWRPGQGAVLYSHGNAGNLSHRGEGLRRWINLTGRAVLIFDYPGYGRSAGRPSEDGCLAAGATAHAWLIGVRHVPAEQVLLYGGSLGGAIATDLAARGPHRALVLVSAFTSIRDMARKQFPWLPMWWLVRTRFDNLRKIAHSRGPVFIAHGTADRLVPFSQGERLFAAAPEPKQFFPLYGYDHNHAPGPDFYAALLGFLDRTAPAAVPPRPVLE
jgi:fermentation-respiration switch protein FrsA (DUF1100 family)